MANGEKKLRKLNQQHLNNSQIHFFGVNPISSFGVKRQTESNSIINVVSAMPNNSRLNSPKQKYPLLSFTRDRTMNEKKIHFGSHIELDNSKMWPVNLHQKFNKGTTLTIN